MAAEEEVGKLTYKFALCRLLPSGNGFCVSSVINTHARGRERVGTTTSLTINFFGKRFNAIRTRMGWNLKLV